jgi:predicted AlkP superfamily phosphohydrolase/phosphomutase
LLLVRAGHQGTAADVALYVSPLHMDPSDPLVPLTSPPEWSQALAQSYGTFKTAGLASELWGRGDSFIGDAAFLAELEETRAAWEARLLGQLRNDDWRLVVAVDQFSDHVGHFFFAREPERVLDYYRAVDALVGKVLREFVDARTLLLVVSDHGIGRFDTELHLNRWLEREGYLALTPGRDEVHRELGAFYRDELALDGIDWTRTRAYAIGLGGIYLNVRGREAQGIVSPGPEAETLKLRLRESLLALRPPSGGEPVVLAVHDGAAIYPESVPGEAPDLVVGLRDGFRVSWSTALGGVAREVFEPNVGPWGADHCSLDARVVPGVILANRPVEPDSPSVLDVAPTVLSFLGIPVPDSMRGRDLLAPQRPVAARRLP